MKKRMQQWDERGIIFKRVFVFTLIILLLLITAFESVAYLTLRQKFRRIAGQWENTINEQMDRVRDFIGETIAEYEEQDFPNGYMEFVFKLRKHLSYFGGVGVTYMPADGSGFSLWCAYFEYASEFIGSHIDADELVNYMRGQDLMLMGPEAKYVGQAMLDSGYYIDGINEVRSNGSDLLYPVGTLARAYIFLHPLDKIEDGGYIAVVLSKESMPFVGESRYGYTISCPYHGNFLPIASTVSSAMQKGDFEIHVPGNTWYMYMIPSGGMFPGGRIAAELIASVLLSAWVAERVRYKFLMRKFLYQQCSDGGNT